MRLSRFFAYGILCGILLITSFFGYNTTNAGSISWNKDLPNFKFLTAFVGKENNLYLLTFDTNATTCAFKFASDGSLLLQTELNEVDFKNEPIKFTNLNNGTIVSYPALLYQWTPTYSAELSYYDSNFNLDHEFIIDAGKIAEGYGLLALRVTPGGDIYLMLSTNIFNSTDNYVRFVHLSSNGSVLWNTKCPLPPMVLKTLNFSTFLRQAGFILASVSNIELNAIYYSVGNALFKLDPKIGKLDWIHIVQSGIYGICATSIGVVIQTIEEQNNNPLYKLICISPDNNLLWSANAISKQMTILSLADFKLETKDDIIGCMFIVCAPVNNLVGKWLFYSLWDKNGRKIDEYTTSAKTSCELSRAYLARGSCYVVITPDNAISGTKIYWYQAITKHATSHFVVLVASLVLLSPLFKKLKKIETI